MWFCHCLAALIPQMKSECLLVLQIPHLLLQRCVVELEQLINQVNFNSDELQSIVQESPHPYPLGTNLEGHVKIPG